MKETNAFDTLLKFRDQFETTTAAAKALGVSKQYLGDLLSNRRDPSKTILAKLGLRRVVVKETTK